MVKRLSDMPEVEANHLRRIECPTYDDTPPLPGKPLAERRVAIISTAGLHKRGDRPFRPGDGSYRVIPAETPANELVMSHISVNFDRTGFQQDLNIGLPDRPAARAGGRRHGRLDGGGALFLHGRLPARRGRAACPASRRPAEGRQGRRRPARPGLTRLHARRRRAGPLPRTPGHSHHRHQPGARAHRDRPPAARAVGHLRARPAAGHSRRSAVPAPRRQGRARPAGTHRRTADRRLSRACAGGRRISAAGPARSISRRPDRLAGRRDRPAGDLVRPRRSPRSAARRSAYRASTCRPPAPW